MKKKIHFVPENRNCPSCGAVDSELLFEETSTVVRKSTVWRFPINIAICKHCSFVFSSPAISENKLLDYHKDGLSNASNAIIPYDIAERLKLIDSLGLVGGRCIEIGGDEGRLFQSELLKYFDQFETVEIVSESSSSYSSISEVPDSSADVILHYDVLEHIYNPLQFLENCARILKPDGLMICEVPNLERYKANVLILEPEHLSHFTPYSLAVLAKKAGFSLISMVADCSRPTGFAAVFTTENIEALWLPEDDQATIRGYIEKAVNHYDRLVNEISTVSERIKISQKNGKRSIIWGVTDVTYRLLERLDMSDAITVIDINPKKADFLEELGFQVVEPNILVKMPERIDLLVVCIPRYKASVEKHLAELVGSSFADIREVYFLGLNDRGESLF